MIAIGHDGDAAMRPPGEVGYLFADNRFRSVLGACASWVYQLSNAILTRVGNIGDLVGRLEASLPPERHRQYARRGGRGCRPTRPTAGADERQAGLAKSIDEYPHLKR